MAVEGLPRGCPSVSKITPSVSKEHVGEVLITSRSERISKHLPPWTLANARLCSRTAHAKLRTDRIGEIGNNVVCLKRVELAIEEGQLCFKERVKHLLWS